jgi:hypothetical protein
MQRELHKVAVVGSREFPDLVLVDTVLDAIGPCIIVSGGAIGVDRRARDFALLSNWPEPITFLPDWKQYGKAAGFIRNSLIIDASEVCLAFWDGHSNGTRDSMKKAYEKGLPLVIFEVVGPHSFTIKVKNNADRHPILTPFAEADSERYSFRTYTPAKVCA